MKRKKLYILTLLLILCLTTKSYCYENYDIPILTYHVVRNSIPDDATAYLYVKPYVFQEQIQTIKNDGYTFLTFEDLVEIENGNKKMPDKPIMITFDDGYLNNYVYAYPILKNIGAKATIFVITNNLPDKANVFTEDKLNFMSWENVNELKNGDVIDIQSHSNSHNSFLDMTLEEGLKDATTSYNKLTEKTGIEPIAISVPYGFTSNKVNNMLLSKYKYVIGVTKYCSSVNNVLYRHTITNDMTGEDIIKEITK